MELRIGVISDTHDSLRSEAAAFLQGCDHIIHAGDICEARVLEELSRIAPVTAVRGNNDHGAWAQAIRETELLRFAGVSVFILHDLAQLSGKAAAGANVVVSGHSHKPLIEERGGVIYLNPGSAGPRRFSLPVAIGELRISGNIVVPRVMALELAKTS